MSSKASSLLKRAELFERIAIYGDRKTFLKTIAFDKDTFYASFNKAKEYLADAKKTVGYEAVMPEPSNIDEIGYQIDKVMSLAQSLDDDKRNQATSDLLGARTALKQAKENAPELPGEPEEEGVGTRMPEEVSSSYPSVPKDIQQALGFTGTQVDGLLGPETRRRLDAQKLFYKLPSSTPDTDIYKKMRGDSLIKETPF